MLKKNKICQTCHDRLINSACHMLNTLDSRGKKKKEKKALILQLEQKGYQHAKTLASIS